MTDIEFVIVVADSGVLLRMVLKKELCELTILLTGLTTRLDGVVFNWLFVETMSTVVTIELAVESMVTFS